MSVLIVRFEKPSDITAPGFDGRVIGFPLTLIDAAYVGQPRQSSQTQSGRVVVEASGTLLAVWAVSDSDVEKVLFQIAKEHLVSTLESGASLGQDLKVDVNTYTYPGPCPFDTALIEDPHGAVVQIEFNRPIGFV
ncbi:MAG: hypothetical protein ACREXX_03040 [Gammaproteobacteria bacterium]